MRKAVKLNLCGKAGLWWKQRTVKKRLHWPGSTD